LGLVSGWTASKPGAWGLGQRVRTWRRRSEVGMEERGVRWGWFWEESKQAGGLGESGRQGGRPILVNREKREKIEGPYIVRPIRLLLRFSCRTASFDLELFPPPGRVLPAAVLRGSNQGKSTAMVCKEHPSGRQGGGQQVAPSTVSHPPIPRARRREGGFGRTC